VWQENGSAKGEVMFDLADGWVVAGWVGGLVLLFGVGTLLFQAGCALADVNGPGFLKSLLVSGSAAVLFLVLAGGLLYFAGKYETDSTSRLGPIHAGALGVSLLATWVLGALLYALFLTAPYRKGLVIAGTELLLAGLLTALVSAVVLVVLALVQISRSPPPRAAGPLPALSSLSAAGRS
jgi:hypothetical protein